MLERQQNETGHCPGPGPASGEKSCFPSFSPEPVSQPVNPADFSTPEPTSLYFLLRYEFVEDCNSQEYENGKEDKSGQGILQG